MWARSRDGKITLAICDMFVDKKQWSEVIEEYIVQEGIALKMTGSGILRFARMTVAVGEYMLQGSQMK